ncbi:MAG: L-threonine 3-dehydrogenase [Clostridia bacterium]
MKKILITGALGQIGSELALKMRKIYGDNNVIVSDLKADGPEEIVKGGPFEVINVTDADKIASVVKKYDIDHIVHLAALLSAVAEDKPNLAWDVNMGGLYNCLEVCREFGASMFTPSSIAAFGPSTPPDNTPQDTIQRPTTMYGVTKVSGELLCDYYAKRFGVDVRGVRYPGLISYKTLPGGGTTDYAVHIFYDAITKGEYTSFIDKGTKMDMMYMPDALDAIIQLSEADENKLIHRNAFNVTAMSFAPEDLEEEIKKHIPSFKMKYDVDRTRQSIADSWPNSLDDSAAKKEWGWNPKYDLELMTKDMIEKLSEKLKK